MIASCLCTVYSQSAEKQSRKVFDIVKLKLVGSQKTPKFLQILVGYLSGNILISMTIDLANSKMSQKAKYCNLINPMIATGRSNRLINDVAKLPQADYNGSKKQSKQLSY